MIVPILWIGVVLCILGAVALYLMGWGSLYKEINEQADNQEYGRVAVLSAVFMLYTGAGIVLFGAVI